MGNIRDHIRFHPLIPYAFTDGIGQTLANMIDAFRQLIFIALILTQIQLIIKFSLGDLFNTFQDLTRCEK